MTESRSIGRPYPKVGCSIQDKSNEFFPISAERIEDRSIYPSGKVSAGKVCLPLGVFPEGVFGDGVGRFPLGADPYTRETSGAQLIAQVAHYTPLLLLLLSRKYI